MSQKSVPLTVHHRGDTFLRIIVYTIYSHLYTGAKGEVQSIRFQTASETSGNFRRILKKIKVTFLKLTNTLLRHKNHYSVMAIKNCM